MYDIIIIGAGPAGLTAAIYALRANKKVIVFEAKSYGGQILNAKLVENYPGVKSISGYDLATSMFNQAKDMGAEIKFETVLKIDEEKNVITNKGNYQAKAIILATGSENRKLNIENEGNYVGKGISYCATCDGNFYKNKIVAVVGGGNTALEDALYLSDIASKVYLIHRRDTFRAEEKYVLDLNKKDNIEPIYNSNVTKLIGEEKLTGIVVTNNSNENKVLDIDGLFIAIGQTPKNEIFANIIELENGYIKTNDGVHTNISGIYVAGDTRIKMLRQLVTATSDGAIAATMAVKEMN